MHLESLMNSPVGSLPLWRLVTIMVVLYVAIFLSVALLMRDKTQKKNDEEDILDNLLLHNLPHINGKSFTALLEYVELLLPQVKVNEHMITYILNQRNSHYSRLSDAAKVELELHLLSRMVLDDETRKAVKDQISEKWHI
jgi:hypothetical protein